MLKWNNFFLNLIYEEYMQAQEAINNPFKIHFYHEIDSFQTKLAREEEFYNPCDRLHINGQIAQFAATTILGADLKQFSIFDVAEIAFNYDELKVNFVSIPILDCNTPVIPAIVNSVASVLLFNSCDEGSKESKFVVTVHANNNALQKGVQELISRSFKEIIESNDLLSMKDAVEKMARFAPRAGVESVNKLLFDRFGKNMINICTRYVQEAFHLAIANVNSFSTERLDLVNNSQLKGLFNEFGSTVFGVSRNQEANRHFKKLLKDKDFKRLPESARGPLELLVTKFKNFAEADQKVSAKFKTLVAEGISPRGLAELFNSDEFKEYAKAVQDYTISYDKLIGLINTEASSTVVRKGVARNKKGTVKKNSETLSRMLSSVMDQKSGISPAGQNPLSFAELTVFPFQTMMRIPLLFGEVVKQSPDLAPIHEYLKKISSDANEMQRLFEQFN
jgi:hypothetical protein